MLRIRANTLTNQNANGAPNFPNGVTVTGIATATNVSVAQSVTATTYYGSGSNLTGIDATTIQTGTTKVVTSSTLISNQISGAGIATVQAGGIDVTGIVTATSYRGDGSALTGVGASFANSSINTSGIITATAFIPSVGQLSNRNKVINGAMVVSQRNGTSAVQLSASEQYIVDRFKNDTGSSFDMKADASQSTDSPDGFANSLKLDCDGVSTPTGGHNGNIQTSIEGQDVQDFAFGTSNAKPVTLSFYAKSASQNNGHVYGIQLCAFLNAARNSQTKSFTVTSSWQRFTMTFAATGTVTSTAINNDNNIGIQIHFCLGTGSSDLQNYSTWTADNALLGFPGQNNFFDNTSNELYITGVQLEVGTVATPFEHRSFNEEFQRCLRYYEKSFEYNYNPANNASSSAILINGSFFARSHNNSNRDSVRFKVEKRASPSLTKYGNSNGYWNSPDNGFHANNNAANGPDRTGFYPRQQASGSVIYIQGHYAADSEL